MQTRRIFLRPDEVLEVILPAHPAASGEQQSVLKVQSFRGTNGNAQVLVYSQPFARLHLDPHQHLLQSIQQEDPATTDSNWLE